MRLQAAAWRTVQVSETSAPNTFQKAAKEYRKLGWQGVLLLPAKEKHPPPKGFTGGSAPYVSDIELAKWCKGKQSNNIGLRLAAVDDEALEERDDLPAFYAGNNVDGWELIGIDVDNYEDKDGANELRALIEEHGTLPGTALSSSRWGSGSFIAVFLVPQGYRYMGKAAKAIDVIQKRHRYMVVAPSVHPSGRRYEWRHGDVADAMESGEELELYTGGIPSLVDVAVLPEAWFTYLTHGGLPESEDPISDMDPELLWLWAQGKDGGPLGFADDMCREMAQATARHIALIEDSPASHTTLVPAHWQILNLAAEGHVGLGQAVTAVNSAWYHSAIEKRSGTYGVGSESPEDLQAEITRSVLGALSKIQPYYVRHDSGEALGRPDDPCRCGDSDSFDAESWANKYANDVEGMAPDNVYAVAGGAANPATEAVTKSLGAQGNSDNNDGYGADDAARIADGDYGGLGPVVGPMELLPVKPPNEYGMHDTGNGDHFIDLYGHNVKYVEGRDGWVIWSGDRWHQDNTWQCVSKAFSRVRANQERYAGWLAAQAAAGTPGITKSQAREWRAWAKRSGNEGAIKSALRCSEGNYFKGEPVMVNAKIFDSRPDLLGCTNGVLELRANDEGEYELRPPSKSDYVTYNTHVPYVPWRDLVNAGDGLHVAGIDGQSAFEGWELWMEYLDTFLPEPELQEYVQRALGHLIIGGNPGKRIIFLWGPHDTGKSTMVGAVKGALGDYFGTVDAGLFKPRDLNPGLIRACPLRVIGMSEVEAGSMDADMLKKLTGNDEVMAEAKYSNSIFTGTPQFTPIVACNSMPHIRHADAALEERLLVLPFEKTIDRGSRRYERQTQIEQHSRTAVLSWLIEGWRAYEEVGLSNPPKAVKRQLFGAMSELNSTRQFMSECLIRATDTKAGQRALGNAIALSKEKGGSGPTVSMLPEEWTARSSVVYELYVRWCRETGVTPINQMMLTKELGVGRAMPRRMTNSKRLERCYYGLKINDEWNPHAGDMRLKG